VNPPLAIELAADATRELVRTATVPLHVALHGLHRAHWQRRARAALAAPRHDRDADHELAAFLRAHPPARGGHVFVSAGEASGEAHAAGLLAAVAAAGARPRWTAFGGERLRAAGADVLYPLTEHAVMGIAGSLRALPFVVGAHRRFLELLRDDPPSLVVLVDYPGLHLVMARAARRHGIPVVHYIAPQYWGWGPWRLARYRRVVDATLTILPFEPAFFAPAGIASAYVGHPLLDQLAADAGVADTRNAPLLCIMPGSRRKEIALHLGPMVEIARRLRAARPELRVVLPHRDARRAEAIRTLLAAHDGGFVELELGATARWLRAARAVLVKSGTGSLEACLCGAPTVVVYVLHGVLGRFGYRHLLNVPWFAGANLIANREVARELAIRGAADWQAAEAALAELLDDGPARTASLRGAMEVRERLGAPGASARAARWILPFCGREGAA
jgi:lipid-A-disaccharide synthase